MIKRIKYTLTDLLKKDCIIQCNNDEERMRFFEICSQLKIRWISGSFVSINDLDIKSHHYYVYHYNEWTEDYRLSWANTHLNYFRTKLFNDYLFIPMSKMKI